MSRHEEREESKKVRNTPTRTLVLPGETHWINVGWSVWGWRISCPSVWCVLIVLLMLLLRRKGWERSVGWGLRFEASSQDGFDDVIAPRLEYMGFLIRECVELGERCGYRNLLREPLVLRIRLCSRWRRCLEAVDLDMREWNLSLLGNRLLYLDWCRDHYWLLDGEFEVELIVRLSQARGGIVRHDGASIVGNRTGSWRGRWCDDLARNLLFRGGWHRRLVEAGTFKDLLLQLADGNPQLWVRFEDPAQNPVQLTGEWQDGLQEAGISNERPVSRVLNGCLLPRVAATGQID